MDFSCDQLIQKVNYLGNTLYRELDLIKIEIFVSIILIIFSFNVLVLGGFNLVYITFVLDQYSPSLNLSMSIVYSVIPLSGILIIFYEMCNNLK